MWNWLFVQTLLRLHKDLERDGIKPKCTHVSPHEHATGLLTVWKDPEIEIPGARGTGQRKEGSWESQEPWVGMNGSGKRIPLQELEVSWTLSCRMSEKHLSAVFCSEMLRKSRNNTDVLNLAGHSV